MPCRSERGVREPKRPHARHCRTPAALGHGISSVVDQPARLGAPAEPWFAVRLDRYTTVTDTDSGLLLASYDGIRPLRLRPITLRLPPIW